MKLFRLYFIKFSKQNWFPNWFLKLERNHAMTSTKRHNGEGSICKVSENKWIAIENGLDCKKSEGDTLAFNWYLLFSFY